MLQAETAVIILFLLLSVSSSGEVVLDIDWKIEREVYKIIKCESGCVHGLWGDKNKPYRAYGIAQFQKRTFDWLKKLAGRPELKWKNEKDQLWLLRWAVKNNYSKYWSCASDAKGKTK